MWGDEKHQRRATEVTIVNTANIAKHGFYFLLASGIALYLAIALSLVTVAGCAGSVSRLSPTDSRCAPPPKVRNDVAVLLGCQNNPDDGELDCGYIGMIDDSLCFELLSSKLCGEWYVSYSECDVLLDLQSQRRSPKRPAVDMKHESI